MVKFQIIIAWRSVVPGRVTVPHGLDVEMEDLVEPGPQQAVYRLPVLVQAWTQPRLAHSAKYPLIDFKLSSPYASRLFTTPFSIDSDPSFMVNPNPDQGYGWQKFYIFSWKNSKYFSRKCSFFIWGLHKNFQDLREFPAIEKLSLLQEGCPADRNMKFPDFRIRIRNTAILNPFMLCFLFTKCSLTTCSFPLVHSPGTQRLWQRSW